MHALNLAVLKKPSSVFLSSILWRNPSASRSCACPRTILIVTPLSTATKRSNIRKCPPAAVKTGSLILSRSRVGERTLTCQKSVPFSSFEICAAVGKDFGRNPGGERRGIEREGPGLSKCDGRKEGEDGSSKSLLTLPTMLTIGRVAAVPLLVTTFYMNSWWATTATTAIFIAAAITDWLDGYIARKMRLGTPFGAFLDPVADKLMVATTLVLLCTRPLDIALFKELPWLMSVPSVAIIGREITMSAVREWAASQNTRVLEAVAVNNLGKWKTATQMAALIILLASRDSSLSGSGFLVASGVGLLYVSAGLALWSLIAYMSKIWRLLLK